MKKTGVVIVLAVIIILLLGFNLYFLFPSYSATRDINEITYILRVK